MDFNVAAVGLSVPPVPAYLSTYRPAVSVRNEGIHDADVTGVLRIYDRTTGLMIWSAPLAVAAVPPGETRDAVASLYWTPDHVGDYLVQGFVTTDRDQNPDDNQLPSVTVPVSAEPPPPPPTVPIHATQHEAAGTDPLRVDGLRGRLADTQSPASHASSHGPAGTDVLSVEGLHGRLADAQLVENHGNDLHTPAMATGAELLAHDSDPVAHTLSSGLEHTARRGVANGYPSLDPSALVPVTELGTGSGGGPSASAFLRLDRTWSTPPSGRPGLDAIAAEIICLDDPPNFTKVLRGSVDAGTLQAGSSLHFELGGEIDFLAHGEGLIVSVGYEAAGGLWLPIGNSVLSCIVPGGDYEAWWCSGAIGFKAESGELRADVAGGVWIYEQPVPLFQGISGPAMNTFDPAAAVDFVIALTLLPGGLGRGVHVNAGNIQLLKL